MRPDDPRRAEALDRHWDAVLDGASPERPPGIGADEAALIAALQTRDEIPGLTRAFDDAMDGFMRYLDVLTPASPPDASVPLRRYRIETENARPIEPGSERSVSANGRRSSPLPPSLQRMALAPEAVARASSWAPCRRAGCPPWVSAAILLLLVAVVGMGLLRVELLSGGTPRQPLAVAGIPAIGGTPTGSASVTAQTLLAITASALPTGHAIVKADRWLLRPSATPLSLPPLGGPLLIAVESGAIVVTMDGTEHHVGAGEQLTVPGAEHSAFQAVGPEPAVAFAVYIYPTNGPDWTFDPVAYTFDYLIETSPEGLPGGVAHVVLERLTLPPGSAPLPLTAARFVWVDVGEGALGLTLEGEHLPFRWQSGTERTFRHGQVVPPLAPGTQMTLRNVGADPLTLYRLTLTPGEAAASPAATPGP